jgi:hypothetical protein
MRSDIVPGGSFPDYELPDHTGKVRKLTELQGDDPLILTLARGHYCPKEHQQHLELAAFYPKIAVAYTQINLIMSASTTAPRMAKQEPQPWEKRRSCKFNPAGWIILEETCQFYADVQRMRGQTPAPRRILRDGLSCKRTIARLRKQSGRAPRQL